LAGRPPDGVPTLMPMRCPTSFRWERGASVYRAGHDEWRGFIRGTANGSDHDLEAFSGQATNDDL